MSSTLAISPQGVLLSAFSQKEIVYKFLIKLLKKEKNHSEN